MTTEKYQRFVNSPIKTKSVEEIPGIGAAYGEMLQKAKFSLARQLVGQYLVMNDEKTFLEWLIKTCTTPAQKMEKYRARNCCDALKEFCAQHL